MHTHTHARTHARTHTHTHAYCTLVLVLVFTAANYGYVAPNSKGVSQQEASGQGTQSLISRDPYIIVNVHFSCLVMINNMQAKLHG